MANFLQGEKYFFYEGADYEQISSEKPRYLKIGQQQRGTQPRTNPERKRKGFF
jgi:hypothetical protein